MRAPRGPLAAMDPGRRNRLTVRTVAGVVGLGSALAAIAKPMRAGGYDIVPFEVAGDAATVDRILDAWGPEGVRAARLQTWLDMGFLALYATATAAGCATVAEAARRHDREAVAVAGDVLGWAAIVAAGCDAVENACLLAELSGARGPLPGLARRCALVKFALVTPAAGYALGGVGVLGAARLAASRGAV